MTDTNENPAGKTHRAPVTGASGKTARAGKPEEAAALIAFLCPKNAGYLNKPDDRRQWRYGVGQRP